jgi:hypothetical protein
MVSHAAKVHIRVPSMVPITTPASSGFASEEVTDASDELEVGGAVGEGDGRELEEGKG